MYVPTYRFQLGLGGDFDGSDWLARAWPRVARGAGSGAGAGADEGPVLVGGVRLGALLLALLLLDRCTEQDVLELPELFNAAALSVSIYTRGRLQRSTIHSHGLGANWGRTARDCPACTFKARSWHRQCNGSVPIRRRLFVQWARLAHSIGDELLGSARLTLHGSPSGSTLPQAVRVLYLSRMQRGRMPQVCRASTASHAATSRAQKKTQSVTPGRSRPTNAMDLRLGLTLHPAYGRPHGQNRPPSQTGHRAPTIRRGRAAQSFQFRDGGGQDSTDRGRRIREHAMHVYLITVCLRVAVYVIAPRVRNRAGPWPNGT